MTNRADALIEAHNHDHAAKGVLIYMYRTGG
jgi:hypothetical protein